MRRLVFFLLLLALIGGVAWFFFSKQKGSAPTTTPPSSFLSFLTPDTAKTPTIIADPTTPAPQNTTPADTGSFDRLQQVTNTPVAGFITYTNTTTVTHPAPDKKTKPTIETVTEYILRYVSRVNGYVYEIKDEATPVQISNIYIPNIYEASFADNGRTALLRFLRDDAQTIATYSVPVPDLNPDGTRTQKAGVFFLNNIAALAISPDSKSIAQLTTSPSALITTSDSKNMGRKSYFSSPYTSWLVSWPEKNMYVQTKALSTADGFLYRINATTKQLEKIIGGVKGLTTSVSPSGTYILYSESDQNRFTTKLLNVKTGAVKQLSASILPEKCTWLKNDDAICAGSEAVSPAQYPDSWYAGITSFSDKLYRIYASVGAISTLDNSLAGYDAINLSINENQGVLYFIDKKTGYLWKFIL